VVSDSKITPTTPAKGTPPAISRTSIIAKVDVGFGNTLYIRGEGPGLSWDRGLVMDCVSDNDWIITISDAKKPIVFKFLVNDASWCIGSDFVVEPGADAVLTPAF
jgi:hypothetical protein